MLLGRVFRFVGRRVQKLYLHLKGSVAEQTDKLRFRCDLCGHEVEYGDLQRTYVLCDSARLRYNEDVFSQKRSPLRGGRSVF